MVSLGVVTALLSTAMWTTSVFAATYAPLVYGDEGPAVASLERDLVDLGYYHGNIDGIFGAGVYGGVVDFQKAHGLKVTGKVGPRLWAVLNAAVQPKSTTPTTVASGATPGYLFLGSKGSEVLAVQKDLSALGYYTGHADGVYGTALLRAVQSFQHSNDLPDGGYVGPQTLAALRKALPGTVKAAATVSPQRSSSPALRVVQVALRYRGAPYAWGGNSPQTGFDCSGFMQWVFGQVNIQLPRTSFAQWSAGAHVSRSQLQAGDLVFFTTEGVFANHVGLYLGSGKFISDTTPGQGVVVQNLDSPYWAASFDGGVRILPNA